MNQFKNCIYSGMQGLNKKICHNLNLSAVLGIVLGLVVSICAIGVNIDKNMIYAVKVNNKNIGYVKDLQFYNKALDAIKKTDGSEPLKSISTEKVRSDSKQFLTSEVIEKTARQELNLKMPAVALFANGIEIAKVDNKQEVEKVLEQVKKYYYPKEKGFTIVSSKIKEDITTKEIMTAPGDVLDIDDAVHKIIDGKGIKKTYAVKQGDTLWGVALKNNMSIEQIQAANPGINIDKLKLNQVVNLALNLPYINVEVIANVKTNEVIQYDSKSVIDKSLAMGAKRVRQAGKNGLAEVEENITIVNGDVVEENIIKNTVVQAAVNEVVAVGSKVNNYVASGRFIRPSRGTITSRFGRRWGSYHTGVDFASSTGTPIVAADSGKVSFVGWNGGYGRCLMINHGNGYQTLYGHTSKIYVKQGQSVKKGQVIAAVGSTGNSTGPHVHFEVRKNGTPQNPLSYVK